MVVLLFSTNKPATRRPSLPLGNPSSRRSGTAKPLRGPADGRASLRPAFAALGQSGNQPCRTSARDRRRSPFMAKVATAVAERSGFRVLAPMGLERTLPHAAGFISIRECALRLLGKHHGPAPCRCTWRAPCRVPPRSVVTETAAEGCPGAGISTSVSARRRAERKSLHSSIAAVILP